MNTTIFTDISEDIRELQAQAEAYAEEHDGDITGFPMLEFLEDLERVQADQEAKSRMLCNLGCMALEYEAAAEAMRAQAKRILDAAAKEEKKADGIRAFIDSKMHPTDKIKDDRVSLSKRKSTAVVLTDGIKAEDLPFDYQRVTVAADKTAIKKALEAGKEVEGAAIETRYNLQIK